MRGGGARGRPRRNADATCRRVGHRATQPTPPVDARDINADSSTVTARPNAIVAPGGRRARGGDEWPPTPQRRCHLSTRGPSSNAADTTRQRAGHQRGLLLSDITTERNAGARGTTSVGGGRGATCAAMRLTPPVNARAINAVLKNIKKRLTWKWGWAGEYMMLATTDDG